MPTNFDARRLGSGSGRRTSNRVEGELFPLKNSGDANATCECSLEDLVEMGGFKVRGSSPDQRNLLGHFKRRFLTCSRSLLLLTGLTCDPTASRVPQLADFSRSLFVAPSTQSPDTPLRDPFVSFKDDKFRLGFAQRSTA